MTSYLEECDTQYEEVCGPSHLADCVNIIGQGGVMGNIIRIGHELTLDDCYDGGCQDVYEEVCEAAYDEVCDLVYEEKCSAQYEASACGPETKCELIYEEKCDVSYEQSCETREEEVCNTVTEDTCGLVADTKCETQYLLRSVTHMQAEANLFLMNYTLCSECENVNPQV